MREYTPVWRSAADVRLANATFLIVRAVLSNQIAANVAEPLKSEISKSAEKTILWVIDDYCGTTIQSHRPPRPMPGPRGVDLAMAVATFANLGAKSGSFREELMKVSGKIAQASYGEQL